MSSRKELKKAIKRQMKAFELEEQKIRLKQRRIAAQCTHQDGDKLDLVELNNKGDFECQICGVQFNINPISKEDLHQAYTTLHNAIQQIRSIGNATKNMNTIIELGEIDFNLRQIEDLYGRFVRDLSRNKRGRKDKRNQHNNYGSYGHGNISFIGKNRRGY